LFRRRAAANSQSRLTIDRKTAPEGIQIVPFDPTMDGKRHGELFDFLIRTSE